MGRDFKAFTAEVEAMPAKEREEFVKAWGEPQELHPDLLPYQVELEHSGTWIKHPLVFSMMHDQALNGHVNRQYEQKVRWLAELEDEGKWIAAVWIHERPHRFEALERMQDFMPDDEFWAAVAAVWTDSENIWQQEDEWTFLLEAERPGRVEHIMEDNERTLLGILPATVTVYRGYHRDGRADGLSWTHDRSKAEFFANYMQTPESGTPRIVTGKVLKSDIIAIFLGRNEAEIVVGDPNCVYDREETLVKSD